MKISIIKHGIIYNLVDGKLKEVDETHLSDCIEIFIAVYRDKKYGAMMRINNFELNARVFKENTLYPYIIRLVNKLKKDYSIELNEKELKVLESTKHISIGL